MGNEYFAVEPVSEHILRITGKANDMMYLVEGTQRCAVIDTGCGLGALREFVDTLTDKPCFVVLTHGHTDHAMGTYGFEDVYISPLEQQVYKANRQGKRRLAYIKAMAKDFSSAELQPSDDFTRFKPLAEGQLFSLGGVELEILPGRGHSPGMCTVLVAQDQALVLGDALNYFTLLTDEFALGPDTLRQTLLSLEQAIQGRVTRVLHSHPPGESTPEIIQSGIELCEDILCGNCDDIPIERWGYKGLLAKKAVYKYDGHKRKVLRCDGGIANIVYKHIIS